MPGAVRLRQDIGKGDTELGEQGSLVGPAVEVIMRMTCPRASRSPQREARGWPAYFLPGFPCRWFPSPLPNSAEHLVAKCGGVRARGPHWRLYSDW